MIGSSPPRAEIHRCDRLSSAQVEAVLRLANRAGDADGADPLAEQTLLRLRQPNTPSTHLIIGGPNGDVAGYANLDLGNPGGQATVELVVDPAYRRQGLGRALATAIMATPAPLRAWAHGDHPSAAALAIDLGLRRARRLWQMRRQLVEPLPQPQLPDGVALRAFHPGADEAAWLALNASAFASHPEQGRWAEADLRLRMAEPWFDPAGFLLAVEESSGRLLGFHWTKVHTGPGRSRVGEVYVLGVDPQAHGGGLGRALTMAGLAHLRDQGLHTVMLYVDESNTAAMSLYQRLGFDHWTAHIAYHRD